MNRLKKIIIVLKQFFSKKDETKMIVAPKDEIKRERKDFVNLLKENFKKKNKVETQINTGDGLGIQRKMKF